MKVKKEYVLMIVAGVVVAGMAFFAGMQVGKGRSAGKNFAQQGTLQMRQAGRGQQNDQNAQNTMGRGNSIAGNQGMIPVAGEVVSVDGNTVTIKTTEGSNKIVILAESTSYKQTSDATATDVKSGEKMTVFGISNADGSVTAQTITLGQSLLMGGIGKTQQVSPTPQN